MIIKALLVESDKYCIYFMQHCSVGPKNIEKHAAQTIVSWRNRKQW